MSMKILVIGYYYSMNLGDTVICDCVASWLRETFPADEIVIRDIWGRREYAASPDVSMQMIRKQRRRVQVRTWLTQHTTYDSQLKHEQYVLEKYGAAMRQIAEEPCDLVVFAGGQLLTDLMSHELSFYIRAFGERHVPVFLHALGTGPCHSRNLNRELKEALHSSSVAWLSVRDHLNAVNQRYFDAEAGSHVGNCVRKPVSEVNSGQKDGAEDKGPASEENSGREDGAEDKRPAPEENSGWNSEGVRRAVFAADPGLWAADVYHVNKKQSAGPIGLGIMYPGSIPMGKAVRFWKRLICLLNKNGVRWQIFTNGDNRDQLFASYILDQIPSLTKEQRDSCCAAPPENAEGLVRQISGYRSIVSFRLHSHIIAASLQVPSVAVVWDDKLREFFGLFDREKYCLSVSDSPEKVLETLREVEQSGWPEEKILQLREESRKMLEQAVERYH